MKRNYGKEIDTLRDELQRLSQLIEKGISPVPGTGEQASQAKEVLNKMNEKVPRAKELLKEAEKNGWLGAINSYSAFSCNDHGYFSDLPSVSADSLLERDNDLMARVLSTFAHKQRLAILKTILIKPMSASEILEKLNMGTTGQVYHHINALLSVDMITQNDDGKYAFKGHRVHAFLLILAGVNHVLSERYSKGNWSVEEVTKISDIT